MGELGREQACKLILMLKSSCRLRLQRRECRLVWHSQSQSQSKLLISLLIKLCSAFDVPRDRDRAAAETGTGTGRKTETETESRLGESQAAACRFISGHYENCLQSRRSASLLLNIIMLVAAVILNCFARPNDTLGARPGQARPMRVTTQCAAQRHLNRQ